MVSPRQLLQLLLAAPAAGVVLVAREDATAYQPNDQMSIEDKTQDALNRLLARVERSEGHAAVEARADVVGMERETIRLDFAQLADAAKLANKGVPAPWGTRESAEMLRLADQADWTPLMRAGINFRLLDSCSERADKWFLDEYSAGIKPEVANDNHHCELEVCNRWGPQAPTVYTYEREDGSGGRLASALLTMGIAHKLGLNFGGVMMNDTHVKHGVDTFEIASGVIGNGTLYSIFFPGKQPHYDQLFRWNDLPNLTVQHKLKTLVNGSRLFMSPFICHYAQTSHIEEDFWRALHRIPEVRQSQIMTRPLSWFNTESRPTVAIHLRRFDLMKGIWRWTPDEYYYSKVAWIRKIIPDADVHVFSATFTGLWSSGDFDGYRLRGMQVHLDTDILDTWAHMARANVLILSQSAFSYLPGYFAPGAQCGIYPDYILPGRTSWISGTVTRMDLYDLQLRKCIQHAVLSLGRKVL